MRFDSALVLGLSFLTAFAAAEAPINSRDAAVVDKRDLSNGLFHNARDAVVGAFHEVEERAAHGLSPRRSSKKPTKKPVTSAAVKTTIKPKPVTTQSKTIVTPTSTSVKTTSSASKVSSSKTSTTILSTSSTASSSVSKTSSKTSSTVVSTSSTVSSSSKTISNTVSVTTTATGTNTGTVSNTVSATTITTGTNTGTASNTLSTSTTASGTNSDITSSTLSTTITATGTSTETTASGTQTSTSASSTSTIKARVRCGQTGSTCSGDSCSLARSIDFRQAINRRAYGNADGQIKNLINRKGNVKLSNQALRDQWIDFGTDAASVTIGGLTGCTAVIAIGRTGMYAFHIWEAGLGDTLEPSKYESTLAAVRTKLASKQAELAGGQLYVYMPTNPDQKGQLLYDSTHWNDDLTEEESEPVPAGDKKWTKQVPRVNAIRNAIIQGSGLSITKETTYEAPLQGVKTSDWMTAQFDPAADDNGKKQFGVWTSEGGQIAQTEWTEAATQ